MNTPARRLTSLVCLAVALATPRAVWADASGPASGRVSSFAPLVNRVKGAVVNVEGTSRGPTAGEEGAGEELFDHFGTQLRRDPRQEIRQGAGSGFVIDPRGIVLTNNHVVAGAIAIRVKFEDGRTFEGEVLGRDPPSDLALLKLKGAHAGLPFLELGDSDAVRVGDWVMAIGNPFGLASSVSVGILSARAREIDPSGFSDFLQTDAANNPGNSGGPLFDVSGKVVGINTALVSGGSGIGFAVPSNVARALIPELEKNGSVSRGYVGVALQNLTPELAGALSVPGSGGALINQVSPDSPGAKAGLQVDDVITALDSRPAQSDSALRRGIAMRPPGATVTLTVVRAGKPRDVRVVLARRPDERVASRSNGKRGGRDDSNRQAIGLSLRTMDPRTADETGLPSEGALIEEVQPGSPADRASLAAGMVVIEAGGRPIRSAEDLSRFLRGARGGSTVLLRVRLPVRENLTRLAALAIPG